MPFITRLVNNSLGWTKPSGIDCKCINPAAPLFEVTHGFGFEEWLFKASHKVFINGEGYYLGYLEGLNKDANVVPSSIDRIYLFTAMFKNGCECCTTETKRIIGFLNHCELITKNDIELIVNNGAYNMFYRNMRLELFGALKNDKRCEDALKRFDNEYENGNLFNVKFKSANRFSIPSDSKNWDYLQNKRGTIEKLKNTFSIDQIDASLLKSYISINGGHVNLVLHPFFDEQ